MYIQAQLIWYFFLANLFSLTDSETPENILVLVKLNGCILSGLVDASLYSASWIKSNSGFFNLQI